jgi:hypothetical protein
MVAAGWVAVRSTARNDAIRPRSPAMPKIRLLALLLTLIAVLPAFAADKQNVCANSLKAFNLKLNELLPGLVEASAGGVVRIAELQSQGYRYIRP